MGDDRRKVERLLAEAWHATTWARDADPSLHIRLTRCYAGSWGFVQGSIRRGEAGMVLWDAAGVVSALSELHDAPATLEAGTLLQLAAADQGGDDATLRQTGAAIADLITAAANALDREAVERIRSDATALPNGQRAQRILSLARSVTAKAA